MFDLLIFAVFLVVLFVVGLILFFRLVSVLFILFVAIILDPEFRLNFQVHLEKLYHFFINLKAADKNLLGLTYSKHKIKK